jgi:hypothetical protein
MSLHSNTISDSLGRRSFIGGSDARIVMGDDEAALVRLWREKRGEIEPEDLSDNLIVQLGTVTEDLTGAGIGETPALPSGCAATDAASVIKWMVATGWAG